eukprot:284817679_5
MLARQKIRLKAMLNVNLTCTAESGMITSTQISLKLVALYLADNVAFCSMIISLEAEHAALEQTGSHSLFSRIHRTTKSFSFEPLASTSLLSEKMIRRWRRCGGVYKKGSGSPVAGDFSIDEVHTILARCLSKELPLYLPLAVLAMCWCSQLVAAWPSSGRCISRQKNPERELYMSKIAAAVATQLLRHPCLLLCCHQIGLTGNTSKQPQSPWQERCQTTGPLSPLHPGTSPRHWGGSLIARESGRQSKQRRCDRKLSAEVITPGRERPSLIQTSPHRRSRARMFPAESTRAARGSMILDGRHLRTLGHLIGWAVWFSGPAEVISITKVPVVRCSLLDAALEHLGAETSKPSQFPDLRLTLLSESCHFPASGARQCHQGIGGNRRNILQTLTRWYAELHSATHYTPYATFKLICNICTCTTENDEPFSVSLCPTPFPPARLQSVHLLWTRTL